MADTMTLEQVRDRLQLYTDYRSTGGHEGKHLSPADLEACADAIDAAIKQREQDAKDAERYRWLKKNDNCDLLAEDVIDEAIVAMEKESGR